VKLQLHLSSLSFFSSVIVKLTNDNSIVNTQQVSATHSISFIQISLSNFFHVV